MDFAAVDAAQRRAVMCIRVVEHTDQGSARVIAPHTVVAHGREIDEPVVPGNAFAAVEGRDRGNLVTRWNLRGGGIGQEGADYGLEVGACRPLCGEK